jgi:hypothetical protein
MVIGVSHYASQQTPPATEIRVSLLRGRWGGGMGIISCYRPPPCHHHEPLHPSPYITSLHYYTYILTIWDYLRNRRNSLPAAQMHVIHRSTTPPTIKSSGSPPLASGAHSRVPNSNAQLEHLETDKKKGKLPSYESEKDYQLNRLMENYGASVSGFGCPKIPVMPPRQKKEKKGKKESGFAGVMKGSRGCGELRRYFWVV